MLPNVVIIGAAKCGTTSLHTYLDQHPDIKMSKTKEINFFSNQTWKKGVDWYESQFATDAKIVGESSTNYSKFPIFDDVPERMASIIPETKLIYVVRDPIERLVSHYMDNVSHRLESRSIEKCLADPDNETVFACSKYHTQIERYLKYFDSSQIYVIPAEDLKDDTNRCMKKVFRFLDVEENFTSEKFTKVLNVSKEKRRKNLLGMAIKGLGISSQAKSVLPQTVVNLYGMIAGTRIERPQLEEKLREQLIERLRPDTERLREFSELDLKQWCL